MKLFSCQYYHNLQSLLFHVSVINSCLADLLKILITEKLKMKSEFRWILKKCVQFFGGKILLVFYFSVLFRLYSSLFKKVIFSLIDKVKRYLSLLEFIFGLRKLVHKNLRKFNIFNWKFIRVERMVVNYFRNSLLTIEILKIITVPIIMQQ